MEIKRYIEENDTEGISLTMLWDALKAVIQGKLIAITSLKRKLKRSAYLNLAENKISNYPQNSALTRN